MDDGFVNEAARAEWFWASSNLYFRLVTGHAANLVVWDATEDDGVERYTTFGYEFYLAQARSRAYALV